MVIFEKYELFQTSDKGRGIKANSTIKAGEEIINEKPLVYTLTNCKTRGLYCDYCFKSPDQLFKCSKCKYTSYCGRGCQTRDWAIHKHECKCLQKVLPKQPPDICRLVSHILFKYYIGKKGRFSDKQDIEGLIANSDFITNTRKEAFFTFGAVLQSYLEDLLVDARDVDIYGLLCRISCNSFTITNSELNSLGTGVYKVSSLLNHSCAPNCIALFNGTEISIRSIMDIKEGEELFIAYVNLLSPTCNRQQDLKEGYMFDCKCSLCSHPVFIDFLMKSMKCNECNPHACVQPMFEDVNVTDQCKQLYRKYYRASDIQKCAFNESTLYTATECCDELDALYQNIKIVPTPLQLQLLKVLLEKGEEILSPTNISLVQCYEVAMDGCLEQEDWNTAYEYSKKLEIPYLLILPKFHPSIGLHYFKQGKLALHLNFLKDGIELLQKAKKILTITHGYTHELVEMLSSVILNANGEMKMEEESTAIEKLYKMSKDMQH